MTESRRSARLLLVFALGVLVFNFPLMAAFEALDDGQGIPGLALMLFGLWALLLPLVRYLAHRL